jgi:hypothetical protein
VFQAYTSYQLKYSYSTVLIVSTQQGCSLGLKRLGHETVSRHFFRTSWSRLLTLTSWSRQGFGLSLKRLEAVSRRFLKRLGLVSSQGMSVLVSSCNLSFTSLVLSSSTTQYVVKLLASLLRSNLRRYFVFFGLHSILQLFTADNS